MEQMAGQLEPHHELERKVHLYHCEQRGLPLALIGQGGTIVWHVEYDEWGNLLNEDNPHNLEQKIRLPGQQYDDESGLCYNRHRYYEPLQGRYITQDPIGLEGGWNPYTYPLNPIIIADPLGLSPTSFSTLFGPAMDGTFHGVDSVAYLPESERQSTLNDFSKMRGMYNPLSEYVFGWGIGAPLVSLSAIFGPAASAGKIISNGSVSCLANFTYQYMENGEINFKDMFWASLTGALSPGRSIIENSLIAMGTTYLNKGDTPGAVTGAGLGTTVSGLLGKVPFLSNIFGDYVSGLVSEGVGDNVEKANSEDSKK